MMRHTGFPVVLALFFGIAVNAQQTHGFAGQWSGSMSTRAGDIPVTLAITEDTGVWRMSPIAGAVRPNPCLGRDMPVVVQSHSPTGLIVRIEGAKVLKGCIDGTLELKSADGKRLEGAMNDGRQVKLSRP